MKIQKKKIFFFGGGGGQGRCEQRSEFFVKIKKKEKLGRIRVDVNEELKFCENSGGGGVGGGGGGGSGWRGVRVGGVFRLGGVRMDVNEELKFL